jgi:hypothetical protein
MMTHRGRTAPRDDNLLTQRLSMASQSGALDIRVAVPGSLWVSVGVTQNGRNRGFAAIHGRILIRQELPHTSRSR